MFFGVSEEEFYNHYHALQKKYDESREEDDLAALIRWTDQQVEHEKRFMHLRDNAFHKLTLLERVAELRPLQRYRKAVLLYALRRKSEAHPIFMELIRSADVEDYIRDRSCGYILAYFLDFIRHKEFQPLFERLIASTDPTAKQLQEQVDLTAIYEEENVDENVDNDATELIAFTSERRHRQSFLSGRQELLWRQRHRPEQYDIFIDFVQEQYYLFGKLTELNRVDANVLAMMILKGSECSIANIYLARYGEKFPQGERTPRSRIDQYFGRLRKLLSAKALSFVRYSLAPGTTYCLLSPESLEHDLDLQWKESDRVR
ncbi:hypothetical protein [Paenibacillus sp. V4I5]|uniref:hypothetical protein n=1 Tax=Paenibacillus sp. V4I5 TaxID=3042306 RepID=UPI0027909D44|nr:hypothetical protein [Paenibacillus sp. V4I5]MDQ0917580.1 hypothetical protein [Paenibacillus sp. V4I5]